MTDHAANMLPVLSSHILAVGHDPVMNALIVDYVDGGTVAYHGAPADFAEQIAKSPSPGAALNALVKSQGFQHSYLVPPLRASRRR